MVEVFPILPAAPKALWLLWGIFALTFALTLMLAFLAWSPTHVRFEVSPEGIRVRGDLFGRTIPGTVLLADQARTLNLNATPEYRPRVRTLGTAVPGYRSGWFRLRNGEKALLFVTDAEHVVYVPTRDGYALMLSVADPAAFLAALSTASGP